MRETFPSSRCLSSAWGHNGGNPFICQMMQAAQSDVERAMKARRVLDAEPAEEPPQQGQQGPLQAASKPPKYTPLEAQVVELKQKYPGVILLVEVSCTAGLLCLPQWFCTWSLVAYRTSQCHIKEPDSGCPSCILEHALQAWLYVLAPMMRKRACSLMHASRGRCRVARCSPASHTLPLLLIWQLSGQACIDVLLGHV